MEDMDIEFDDDKIIKISNFVEHDDGSATFTMDAAPKMMAHIVQVGIIKMLEDSIKDQEAVDGTD